MLASPLRDLERAAGAVLRRYGGLELPEKFADVAAEVEAARSSAGLFDLAFRSRLAFRGADRATFLHNLLSNEVLSLGPGAGCYTTLLTQQSKVVVDGNLFVLEEVILFDVDRRLKGRAREHLEKFLIADEVEIDDLEESEASIGIEGPRSIDILRIAAGGVEPPASPYRHAAVTIGGASARVARVHWTGDPGFDVTAATESAAAVWQALRAAGEPLGLVPAGMAAFNILRIEAGIPWVGVDVDESHLVLEAGLERGISFQKGCYLGQEVVERASARGHVNRRLVGLRLDGAVVPKAGAKVLRGGAEVGRVTSAVYSPAAGTAIAMGYVRREAMAAGSRLEIESAGGAEVVSMPFLRRGS